MHTNLTLGSLFSWESRWYENGTGRRRPPKWMFHINSIVLHWSAMGCRVAEVILIWIQFHETCTSSWNLSHIHKWTRIIYRSSDRISRCENRTLAKLTQVPSNEINHLQTLQFTSWDLCRWDKAMRVSQVLTGHAFHFITLGYNVNNLKSH